MATALQCNLCERASAPRQPSTVAAADVLATHLVAEHYLNEYRDRVWYLRHFGLTRPKRRRAPVSSP